MNSSGRPPVTTRHGWPDVPPRSKPPVAGRLAPSPRPRRPGGLWLRRANTTDPHSRIIATASKGVLQGYNAQAAATTRPDRGRG